MNDSKKRSPVHGYYHKQYCVGYHIDLTGDTHLRMLYIAIHIFIYFDISCVGDYKMPQKPLELPLSI